MSQSTTDTSMVGHANRNLRKYSWHSFFKFRIILGLLLTLTFSSHFGRLQEKHKQHWEGAGTLVCDLQIYESVIFFPQFSMRMVYNNAGGRTTDQARQRGVLKVDTLLKQTGWKKLKLSLWGIDFYPNFTICHIFASEFNFVGRTTVNFTFNHSSIISCIFSNLSSHDYSKAKKKD